MNCPSCNFSSEGSQTYCIRCGFPLARRGLLLVAIRGNLAWILRRSFAGLTTGLLGWFVVAASGRMAGSGMSQLGHLLLTGLVGGCFLGTVEGMVEDSTLKMIRGGFFGILGGLVGGLAGTVCINVSSAGMTAVVAAWAITGAAVGAASVWLERQALRIAIGGLAGLLGGALGGWLGYQMYASLADMTKADNWWLQRAIEGTTGAVLGAILWFIIAVAEKFWIFRRRVATNISYKECDRCKHTNVLRAWYCASCGALLQVAAPAEKLQLPRRQALARVISALQFLAQLSVVSGAIVSVLAASFLGIISPFLGLFGLLVVALVGYLFNIAFSALADLLSPLLDPSTVNSAAVRRSVV